MGPKNDAAHVPICLDCGAKGRAYEKPGHATFALNRHQCDDTCGRCRFAKPAGPGHRGLCRRCYDDPAVRLSRPRPSRSALDIAGEAEWYVAFGGGGVCDLARSLGLQVESLRRSLQRVGRLELYDALADREPSAELRRRTREGIRARRARVAA